jgi:FkbM family methyltransferase
MSMNGADIRRLDEAARLASGSALGKLRARPLSLGVSKVLELYCRASRSSVRVTGTTFWGDRMQLVAPDRVSLTILRYGFFEVELTKVLASHLKPGAIFFDVGSHFGYFSMLAASLVGPAGQVHAFEPTPSTFRVLQTNLARHPNARAVNVAAYREDTQLEFKDYGVEFSAFNTIYDGKVERSERRRLRAHSVQIRARALDAYVSETGSVPDFVKIDAEGAEPDVLAGFDRTLRTARPIVTLEVGDKDVRGVAPSRDVVRSMLDRNYKALEFKGSSLVPHAVRDRYGYENLLFVPA